MGLKFVPQLTIDSPTLETKEVDTEIRDSEGKITFQQKRVEVPASFSTRAATIIASQYFRGHESDGTRETSFIDVVTRVIGKICEWGEEGRYFDGEETKKVFAEELFFILTNQMAAFNSPVWYNLGVEGETQQGSACFIGDVEDNMTSIAERLAIETRVFKWGSGFGANNSKLRGSMEKLTGGGCSSGPVSFMLIYDAAAEVVKSAGKRRAAKIELMDIDHPDIEKFISCKGDQEALANMIKSTMNKDAINQTQVRHQNANHSVVINDKFMKSCTTGEQWSLLRRGAQIEEKGDYSGVKMIDGELGAVHKNMLARDLLMQIAEQTWKCGDPGVFFKDSVNRWNTVPSWGEITACNPCAEFLQPAWSACNLSSINLEKFFEETDDGWHFLTTEFNTTVFMLTVAMDIIARFADYPEERITENSIKYRPLGLGFSNLGALLIRMGIPYDSDKARTIAKMITAHMSGAAWVTSSVIAQELGEGDDFPREDVIHVLQKHQTAVNKTLIKDPGISGLDWFDIGDIWDTAVKMAVSHGVHNSQVSLLAPTGTISFLMDCETTGIEPLVMLGGVKKMADTGVMKFSLPRCVDSYLLSTATREDAESLTKEDESGGLQWTAQKWFLEALKEGHVLDTALGGMEMGVIDPMGHLKMMAAVQEFLSGGISKTVNVPNSTTAEDIFSLYVRAWEMGIKSLAIYRDGSKFEQVYNKSEEPIPDPTEEKNGLRLRLPDERESRTHKFAIGDHKGYVTTGFYPNGDPGEIFILMNKQGSTVRGLLDSVAILVSVCLQYGVPLEDLIRKFKGVKFEPQGMTRNPNIPFAKSPMDYIFRYLELMSEKNEPEVEEEEFVTIEDSGEPCSACGTIMQRRGSCMYCDNCDTTTGCS